MNEHFGEVCAMLGNGMGYHAVPPHGTRVAGMVVSGADSGSSRFVNEHLGKVADVKLATVRIWDLHDGSPNGRETIRMTHNEFIARHTKPPRP